MAGPVNSSSTAPFGGAVFNPAAKGAGPAPQDFNKSPGIWQTLYNKAAEAIGLPQIKADAKQPANALVVRELDRENHNYHASLRGPVAHAEKLIKEAHVPGFISDSVDTPRLAAEVIALRRDLPALAPQVEREIMTKLGNAGDQSRFAEDVRAAASHGAAADQKLQSAATLGAPRPPALSRAQISAETNALISGATTITSNWKTGLTTTNFSVASIVAKVAERAETDPVAAQLIRADLTARLTPQEGAQLNRQLAGEGGFFENMAVAAYDPVDGSIGVVKGLANDGISILNAAGKGEMMRAASEAENAAALQSLFGMEKAASQSRTSADILREASKTDAIPNIPYSNAAQQGGANAATVAEMAGGATALAKGAFVGGKWVVKNAPELLAKRTDDVAKVAKPIARQLDTFDELAANAKIDMPHILAGHLNKKGQAVGFHHRADGIDPPNSRMTQQVGLKNSQEVYIGKIEVRDPTTGNWVAKKSNSGESTFYPDHMTPKEVEAAVRHAYADALRTGKVFPNGKFVGDSGLGFKIEGIARNNEIPTAFPQM